MKQIHICTVILPSRNLDKTQRDTNPIPRVPPVTRADMPWRDHLSAMELCDAQRTRTEEGEY
ncbi:hypothetical protein AALP_AA8G332300 [Arabis alpina]|uniref:Uncharacterized protein n=1 Tax=Arabis alpina TaxID=50452 RepID=A0A087GB34_ARAAL|nr:hypothetical protein AALP_AA8G332300 [Arabis alpina]